MGAERGLAGTAGSYTPTDAADWADPPPTTIADGLDRLAKAAAGSSSSFVMKMAVLPEPDPGDSLAALGTSTAVDPNQQALPSSDPTGLQDLQHVFIFPTACRLGTFRAFGSTDLLGTFNQRVITQPIDLYVNGARVRTLVTIPAGDGGLPGPGQDFDLTDAGGDEFAAGDLVQFVLPIPGASSGTLNGVLFSFSVH